MATEPDATLLAQEDASAFFVPLAPGAAANDVDTVLKMWGVAAAFEDYDGFVKNLKAAGG